MSIVFSGISVTNDFTGAAVTTKAAVRAATTTDGALATAYENGDTIDGVTLATNDRILIKNQSTATENGVYIVQASGAPVRASDFDDGESVASVILYVKEGTTNADTGWMCTNDAPNDVVGTDNLSFSQIAGSGVDGDLSGPASSTDNEVVRFDGTTGKLVQTSGLFIDDSQNLSGINNLVLESGTNDTTLTAASQSTSAPTITIPDLGGTSGDMVITNASQTLTNKTLTSPIVNQILDSNSNEEVIFTTTASAVNEFTMANAATGNNPALSVTGGDTNIGLDLQVKGTGTYNLLGTATTQASLRFHEDTDNGSNYIAVQPAAAIGSNVTLTLPEATDTLVGRATSDTLTNKTINADNNTISNLAHGSEVDNPSSGVHGVTGNVVGTTDTQTLTNKTLTSPVLTTPEINDTSADHQYIFAVSELAADRTVTLPLLTGNDTFVFNDFASTLTNKTIAAGSNTISGLTHGSEVDNPSSGVHGVTGSVVGTTDTQTLTNKTLTSPQIGTSILDTNGNELFGLTATGSAVNELTYANAATANNPTISATGNDTNIGLDFQVKGTGTYNLLGTATTQASLRFHEDTDNGSNYIAVQPAAAIGSNVTLTLPEATDTLVGRDTTDTLTNKTIAAGSNTISGLTHGSEVDNPSSGVHGVTGNVVGTTDTQTLTNKTLTSPIVNQILDSNSNEEVIFTATASAVNEFTVANAATGNNPTISATGGDTNIGLDLQVKGTGTYNLLGTATTQASLRFHEDTDNGTNYIAVQPPAAIGSNVTLTLPEATDTLVGRDTTDTLTNKTLTTPSIDDPEMTGAFIMDDEGNEIFQFWKWSNSVNYVRAFNAASTVNPGFSAQGDDTNIGIRFEAKGTGTFDFRGNTSTQAVLRLYEDQDTGSNYVQIQPPANISANATLTLPTTTDTLVARTTTDTLTNKTLTSPQIGTSILDTNGNELFGLTATGSAVNELTVANAATGNNPTISATGGDANIGIDFVTKGTGVFNFSSASASDQAEIRLQDDTGGQYAGITVPGTVTTSYTLTLPDGVGSSGQFLRTDGNNPATLSWVAPAGGGDVVGPGSSTDNAIARFDGTSGTSIQNSGLLISDTNDLLDANGNELINFTSTASAVNEISITNSATGVNARLGVTGEANRGMTIHDSNDNELLILSSTASAVNELTIANAATANNPVLSVTGGDTNIGLSLQSKGTGTYRLLGTSTARAELRMYEQTGNGTNYIAFRPPASVTADRTLVFPDSVGTSGQVLRTDGSNPATLTWGVSNITNQAVTATADTSTTSSTYVVVNTMTITPASGTYLAMFSTSGGVGSNNATGHWAIHVGGTIVSHSERQLITGGGPTSGMEDSMMTQAIVTPNGSQAVDVRYQTSTGTFTMHERSLTLIRLS